MRLRTNTVATLVVVALTLSTLSASLREDGSAWPAQQTFDRKQLPKPGPTPQLRVPQWTTTKLANGAMLIVSERHDLPLVSFSMTFLGGTNQFEKADKVGVAGFTTSMLREGTKTRSGEQLSLDLQLLGTNIGAGVSGESGSLSFLSTAETFAPTLEIMTDMLLNSTFPADALERLRQQRLVQLAQANAQPNVIGNRVFSRVLYGHGHPFAYDANETTIKAVTRDDVVAFHKAYYQPARAIITVVGDVTAASVKSTIEKAFAGWPAGGEKPSFTYPATPAARATTIYLVDRPGSKQSSFNIGLPGPPRNTPDYIALQVMNFILGGHFQSRLNANIREEKGYSYGVSSSFAYGRGPGPFRAGGDVVSDKTDLALIEFMKELRGIHGGRAITDDEMVQAKDALIQRLPNQFASVSAIGSSISTLYVQELPVDYYQTYPKLVNAVTKDDVLRVAKKYIDLDHLNIVIVGDRKAVEEPLKKTGIAPIVILDNEGK
jgi:zinc protease